MSGEETEGGGLPELRFKPGFQNPRNAPVKVKPKEPPPVAKAPKSTAMSIDDMLALTRNRSQNPADSQPAAAPPPVEASPPPEPVIEEKEEFGEVLIGSFEDITVDGVTPGFAPPEPKKPKAYIPPTQPPKKINPMLPKVGLGVIVLAILMVPLVRAMAGAGEPAFTVLVASTPRAELFKGEERIGRTPQTIKIHGPSDHYTLKVVGYKTETVNFGEDLNPSKVNEVQVTLTGEPVALDWAGYPEGAQLWWDGVETTPGSLKEAPAGDHKVKLKPAGQSSFSWTVNIPWGGQKTFPVGKALSNELARRPQLKLSLTGTSEISAVVKNDSGFSQTVTLNKKAATSLSLPGPGKYNISTAGTGSLAPFKKVLDLNAGEKSQVAVALRPVSSGSVTRSGGGTRYSAPRRYSAPPRRYSGGGGGATRIAPPSF